MRSVALINMPFANLGLPSIALAQLRTVLLRECPGDVAVNILHLNHDFGTYLGVSTYNDITGALGSTIAGLGDWVFREAAFPRVPDNSEYYFRRYPRLLLDHANTLDGMFMEKRRGIGQFLDGLIEKYSIHNYDVVGFTSMFMQNVASLAMARRLKLRNPDVITVMGGANCESPMGEAIVRNFACIDYVFSGPALVSFPEFVRQICNNRLEDCEHISGVHAGPRPSQCSPDSLGQELDINHVTDLDYDDFLTSFREHFGRQDDLEIYIPFETSRGCWWGQRAHCTFCGLNGLTMGYRAMAPDRAVEHLQQVFRYGNEAKHFHAVDNILPKEYVEHVFPRINLPEGASIFYEVKADLTASDMARLSAAGVTEMQPGIESFATSTLKLMKKGTTAFHNVAFLKNCIRFEIAPYWNLLIGFPGEADAVYRKYMEDIPWLVHLPPPGGTFPVRFDRYSPYFMAPEQHDLRLEPYDAYALIYPLDGEELCDIAYYFSDTNYASEYIANTAKWIRPLESAVQAWQHTWESPETPVPKLEMIRAGDTAIVRDTRFGTELLHPLTSSEYAVLLELEVQRSPRRLSAICPEEADVMACIATFCDRKWLFREFDQYLSLVIDTQSSVT